MSNAMYNSAFTVSELQLLRLNYGRGVEEDLLESELTQEDSTDRSEAKTLTSCRSVYVSIRHTVQHNSRFSTLGEYQYHKE